MTRAHRRWKIIAIAVSAFVGALVIAALAASFWYRATERTYYGPHTDLLQVGERVTFAEGQVSATLRTAVVQEEPAWDEDSCDPDRTIKVALTSGEVVSVPRRILRR